MSLHLKLHPDSWEGEICIFFVLERTNSGYDPQIDLWPGVLKVQGHIESL